MRYFLETWYLDNSKYDAKNILKDVVSYFFSKCDFCQIEGTDFNSGGSLKISAALKEEEKKKILDCIEDGWIFHEILIDSYDIKEDHKFNYFDSERNWHLCLDSSEYNDLLKFLEKNKYPEDLFFPEYRWEKEILKTNFLNNLLSIFGFDGEASKFYTPRMWKEKTEKMVKVS